MEPLFSKRQKLLGIALAKVQFEPKTSAFIYLKEWGEPKETPDYKVVKIEKGNYIAYAKEYDISFEFSKEADKKAFDGLNAKGADDR